MGLLFLSGDGVRTRTPRATHAPENTHAGLSQLERPDIDNTAAVAVAVLVSRESALIGRASDRVVPTVDGPTAFEKGVRPGATTVERQGRQPRVEWVVGRADLVAVDAEAGAARG